MRKQFSLSDNETVELTRKRSKESQSGESFDCCYPILRDAKKYGLKNELHVASVTDGELTRWREAYECLSVCRLCDGDGTSSLGSEHTHTLAHDVDCGRVIT